MKRLLLCGAFVAVFASLAFAQSATTTTLTGVVVDSAGGVIPGATVSAKSAATGATTEAVTNAEGTFSIPALNPGNYNVTVALQGFKTSVMENVQLLPGVPTEVKAVLDVGSLSETVVVEGASPVVNTTTATITSTLDADQINKIPLPTRNALNAVTFLAGVNTAGVNRDATFNGLPQSFINITFDGITNNDNFNKSTDGFFAMVTPRQDAVEAVAVTSGVGGADVGGSGAVSVNFVTRSGTNQFTGSAYEYHRNPSLNTNYWFNVRNGVPKNDIKLNQFGVRQGGPIVLPGLYDGHNKAFFFFNYEELRLPNNFSRTRNVLTSAAQRGVFSYTRGTATEQVDLLALASRSGFPTALDPLTQRIQGYFNAAMQTTGRINPQAGDPNLVDYVWQSPGNQLERQPLVRVDYNLTENHRLNGLYNWQVVRRTPDHLNGADARFPGAPNSREYVSYRPLAGGALRSTLRSNMVNELRGGFRWGPGSFGQPDSNGPQTFEDTDSLALNITASDANADGLNLTNWHVENGPSARSAWSYNIDDTLTWQKGNHSISMGTQLFFGNIWEDSQQMVPGIRLGINTADPANAMFTTANFPGASAAQLTDAREVYAYLVGRVDQVNGVASLNPETNTYEFLGKRRRAGKMNEYSVFMQDQWRLTPTLTMNAGVRWDVQMPFSPVNDVLTQGTLADACGVSGFTDAETCRFFTPNASGGKVPDFQAFTKGSSNYKTDWNNVAPNFSMAWRPNVQDGWLRQLLGDPDQATLRGGFSVAYERQGFQVFTEQYGSNPGSTLPLARTVENGLLPAGTMLTQRDQLYPQSFEETPTFPIPIRPNRADDVSIFAPDIQVASARTWTFGFQRSITRNMAVEARYVGTRGVNQWTEENWNDNEDSANNINILENGFYDEFRLAMANLQANNLVGGARAGSFAYFGPGSGTNPLPIYLAHLNGSRDANSAAAYSGTNWTNATLAGRLVKTNPLPYSAAADLVNNATRRNAGLSAGVTPTFFLVNPHADDVFVWQSKAYSDYHALQIELRRRLSRGLQIGGSYQYAFEAGSQNLGLRYGRVMSPSDQQVRHAIKTQWNWSIPVGQGRRFGANMPTVLDYVLGGWEFSGAGRHQARLEDFGNVRLVGMNIDELTSMYKVRFENDANGLRRAYMLPADVILNTRRAYNISTSSVTGYSDLGVPEGRYIAPANSGDCIQMKAGDCAPRRVLIRAPFFTRFDVGLTKRFPIAGRVNFELRADVLNVFDNVNFTPTSNPGTAATIFEVTAGYQDLSNTFDPGGRLGQLVFRLNW